MNDLRHDRSADSEIDRLNRQDEIVASFYREDARSQGADTDTLSKSERKRVTALMERDLLRQFYADVCAEAETIMAQTNTVSGAHWNAMKRVLKRRGVEV